jgi:hypothetical protein
MITTMLLMIKCIEALQRKFWVKKRLFFKFQQVGTRREGDNEIAQPAPPCLAGGSAGSFVHLSSVQKTLLYQRTD